MADAQFRYIGKKRRTRKIRVCIGRGRFVADVALAGMKHVALVACRTRAHVSSRSALKLRSQCRAYATC
jgi:hypothetical protein